MTHNSSSRIRILKGKFLTLKLNKNKVEDMKPFGKENVYSCGEQGLRRSIPFKLSSVLKASNKMEDQATICQTSKEYETEKANFVKKPITPLIKSDP